MTLIIGHCQSFHIFTYKCNTDTKNYTPDGEKISNILDLKGFKNDEVKNFVQLFIHICHILSQHTV